MPGLDCQAWNSLASVGFTYLPVWMAFAGARYPMFGLFISNIKYDSSIVPVLLMVPVFALLLGFKEE